MQLSARPAPIFARPISQAPAERDAIRREALRRLRCSGYTALWDIRCDARGDVLQLHGRLKSYYLKQVAQAAVDRIEGVRRVVNLIEVAPPPVLRPTAAASVEGR